MDIGHESANLKSRFLGLTLAVAATVRCGEKDYEEPQQRNKRYSHTHCAPISNPASKWYHTVTFKQDDRWRVLTVTELMTMLRTTIGQVRLKVIEQTGEDFGGRKNDFEPVGNCRGIGDRDRSRCCLRQLDGVRSHTNAQAGTYRYTGAHTNAYAGTYRYTGTQSYTHAEAYRHTDAESTE